MSNKLQLGVGTRGSIDAMKHLNLKLIRYKKHSERHSRGGQEEEKKKEIFPQREAGVLSTQLVVEKGEYCLN